MFGGSDEWNHQEPLNDENALSHGECWVSACFLFQINVNVLQPSAQQRRLRLVLRAGLLLTDVKPPGGQRALAEGQTDGERSVVTQASGFHTHTKAHRRWRE